MCAGGQRVFAAAYLGGVLLVVASARAGHRSAGDVIMVILLAALVNQQVGGAANRYDKYVGRRLGAAQPRCARHTVRPEGACETCG